MPREQLYSNQVLHWTQKHPVVTTATIAVVDRAGCDSVLYVVSKSVCTATTAGVTVELASGTATSAHTLATTSEMIGTQTVTLTATLSKFCKMAYIGSDRYTSIRINPLQTNATGAVSVVAIKGGMIKQPKAHGATSATGMVTTFPLGS